MIHPCGSSNAIKNNIQCVKQDVFVKQMSPIMAKSKYGQVHKDKYLDTSKKHFLTKNASVQYKSSNILFFAINNVYFLNTSNVKVKG